MVYIIFYYTKNMPIKNYKITIQEKGLRTDIVCFDVFNFNSRSETIGAIKRGEITINNKSVKASKPVQINDVLSYTPQNGKASKFKPYKIKLHILYEDSDIIVVNKPSNMVIHPSKGHIENTLLNAVLHHCTDLKPIGGIIQPGILHRLDKDTSGVVIMSKNHCAHVKLKKEFENNNIKKYYLAICANGGFSKDWQLIDLPIAPAHGNKMCVRFDSSAKTAKTKIRLDKNYGKLDLLECQLLTGRTHQIRVHLSHSGYPIIGDNLYGGDPLIKRQALHCYKMQITHTNNQILTFTAPTPPDFKTILSSLL